MPYLAIPSIYLTVVPLPSARLLVPLVAICLRENPPQPPCSPPVTRLPYASAACSSLVTNQWFHIEHAGADFIDCFVNGLGIALGQAAHR
jgi:hypothetical protein